MRVPLLDVVSSAGTTTTWWFAMSTVHGFATLTTTVREQGTGGSSPDRERTGVVSTVPGTEVGAIGINPWIFQRLRFLPNAHQAASHRQYRITMRREARGRSSEITRTEGVDTTICSMILRFAVMREKV